MSTESLLAPILFAVRRKRHRRQGERVQQGSAVRAGGLPAPAGTWWRVAVIALAGSLTYVNSLTNPFVLDDHVAIEENEQIRDLGQLSSVLFPERELPVAGRPVVSLSLAINYALGGLNVIGYRVWNITVHVLCAALLFGIVRRVLLLPRFDATLNARAPHVALATALVWVVHPLNSEVINYVTQRTESMMALFYLLTVYASLRAATPAGAGLWQGLAVVSSALGMGCKESMVTAPIMIALFDRVFLFDSFAEAFRARWHLYAGLAATWLIVAGLTSTGPRRRSAGFSSGVAAWTYLLNQARMVTRYLGLAFWPRSFVASYGWPVSLTLGDVLPQATLVLGLLGLAAAALWRLPQIGFLGAWFFVTLAPTSSIVPIATEVGAERRMYLPLAALMVLAVMGVMWLWDRMHLRLPEVT